MIINIFVNLIMFIDIQNLYLIKNNYFIDN